MYILLCLFFVPSVVRVCSWSAENYWNRYQSSGIYYSGTDTYNGMWSDDGNPYLPNSFSRGCYGCTCTFDQWGNFVELGTCSNDVYVGYYTIPDTVKTKTFANTTTSITIVASGFVSIMEDAFSHLTKLTSLTIQASGLKFLPDISKTKVSALNLIGNRITVDSKFKGRLPETIQYLALTLNSIHWLPPEFISGPNLRLASLGYNAFKEFPGEALGQLPKLMYFGIEGNSVRQVSAEHLGPFNSSTFVHLNLSNNAIEYVEKGAFKQLPNLKILELHNNRLSTIHKGIFEDLKELVHLDIDHNRIEKLTSEAFINLEKLIEFRLQSQNPPMSTILFDSMINIGKSLKYLFISSNALTHLPHQIFMEDNFTQLVELYADNNLIKNITELAESGYGVKLRQTYLQKKKHLVPFSTTPNIVYLYLQNNLIETINNTDMCKLHVLTYLYLQNNRLNEKNIQEDGFKCLPSLVYLNLAYNYNMQFVPVAVTTHQKLPVIVTLDLSSNMISVLPSGTFINVSTLINLYLQYNLIYAVEKDTFPEQLQTIYLFNNRIIAVENGAFKGEITIIYISNNDFRFIHEHQFSYLTKLRELHMQSNSIEYIPDDAFINATSLIYVNLGSNKIRQIKKVHFTNCPLTSAILLGYNEIGWIEDGSFNHVKSCGTWDFSNNRVYKLPMNGTFHDVSISYIYLQNNRISVVLSDTFKNINTNHFSLNSNRIFKIESGAFHTVISREIYWSYNSLVPDTGVFTLSSNQIRVIETNAFNSVSAYYFTLTGNVLGEVKSYAFNKIGCTYFNMENMNLGIIPSYTFNTLSCTYVYLQSNRITDIKKHAFNNFTANYLYLYSNQVPTISASIFGGSSYINHLNLQSNGIQSITSDAFVNVAVDYIYLHNNRLTIYPVALNRIAPIEMHLYSNIITRIPAGSFNSQYRLQSLYMANNQLTQISARLLTPATSLQVIDFSNNQIQNIENGSFDGLVVLNTLNLGQNNIPYFPAVYLPSMLYLTLSSNRIESLGGLKLSRDVISVNLDYNLLGCECTTVNTLYNLQTALSPNTMCTTPLAVRGVLFAASQASNNTHYSKIDQSLFQCTGENIVGAAVSSKNITLSWTRPAYIFYLLNGSYSEALKAKTLTSTIDVWNYLVTCTSNTATTITKTVVIDLPDCPNPTVKTCNITGENSTMTFNNSTTDNSTIKFINLTTVSSTMSPRNSTTDSSIMSSSNFSFNNLTSENFTVSNCNATNQNLTLAHSSLSCNKSTEHNATVSLTDADGLLPLTMYECVIQLTVNNYTSAKSVPTFLSTDIIRSENVISEENFTADQDIHLAITYYDFSIRHTDFGPNAGLLSVRPYHLASPLGSWLAVSNDPTADTFSDWFRSAASNMEIKRILTLSDNQNVTASNVNRYYSDSFFPIDSLGFGAEGQKDCQGKLHNFAFTSKVRTGLKFTGSETITVGGGEEVWVFINKILVIEIIANRTANETRCQRISLSHAVLGNIMIPELGVLVNGECQELSPLNSAAVQIELKIGETYLLEIFHTERRTCTSQFYLQLENVYVPQHVNDTQPFDYELTPYEDLNVKGIVGSFNVWDVFSTGTQYKVEIVSGNEARHFTLKDDTTTNRNAAPTLAPPTYEYINFTGTNMSYIECHGPAAMIPDSYTTGTEMFTITTPQVLTVLVLELDHEVAQNYTLTLSVEDINRSLTGSLILRINVEDVNDNCPELTSDAYITPQLILTINPLFSVHFADRDSGKNADVRIHISPVVIKSPPVNYTYISDIIRQVYNGSTELTLMIIGIDQGTPPRGSAINVTVNISNTCLIDELLDRTNLTFTANESTGDVYLRVPGYWVIHYNCSDYVGLLNGLIRSDQITASSSRSTRTLPDRARLGINASDPVFGPLSGGWVAGSNNVNQYIEVNFEEPYILKQIHLQGQQDKPNWVTAFRIYIKVNQSGSWKLYQNAHGEYIFLGNYDQNNIRTLDLSPPILTQFIRINPRNWTNNIAIRMEFSGCKKSRQFYYDTTCARCYASYYCLGDGEAHTCGRCKNETLTCDRSPTEFSFGAHSECSSCLDGWICKEGHATPCENNTYVLGCNDTYCPDSCSQCEPGYACRGGQRYICVPGTYSDGGVEFCAICTEGKYQDKSGQSECKSCPAGYYSSKSKDRCNPCDISSYSVGDGTEGCVGCTNKTQCPCLDETTCFTSDKGKASCVNMGSGMYQCLKCPPGFTGDGVTCSDIDECAVHNPCWDISACINTVPGYQCLACPRGYTGNYEDGLAWNNTVRVFELKNLELSPIQEQICVDIDECKIDNGGCDPLSPCVNTIGSFYCGFCSEGYAGNPIISCYSTNFCQTGKHTCSQYATCIYLGPGEYTCECQTGYTGNGIFCGLDSDLDGHPDKTLPCTSWGCYRDNCRTIPNCGQEDAEGDRIGDDCDDDSDNDGKIDELDNCPYVHSWNRTDTDNDTVGDACDNCLNIPNTAQKDTDNDGSGDACDLDDDNDGVADIRDNCPLIANSNQYDTDGDKIGNLCDNCVNIYNIGQNDVDQNGFGDNCDSTDNKDRDGDSVLNIGDNCQEAANGEQTDTDNDGIGDACDSDLDGDGVLNDVDNCPFLRNPLQTDRNGDQVGEDCVVDSDGDGIDDSNDTCPYNRYISTTSFSKYFSVDLYPGYSVAPMWRVKAVGREIYQLADTFKPVMLMGKQIYSSIRYSGTVYVRSKKGDNYIGIVFGYVNNRKFYLLSWKPTNFNFSTTSFKTGITGINLKVINSNSGPGLTMANALWQSSTTVNQATVLWHDGNMTRWSNYTSYKWFLTHNADLNKIRVQVYDLTTMLADSGDIYDTSITGGRVGVYQFGQDTVLWSDLKVQCIPRQKALSLDGINDYVILTNISNLNIYRSFTVGVWLLLKDLTGDQMPVFCTGTRSICLWIERGIVHGEYGNSSVTSSFAISVNVWTNVLFIYDESEYQLKLYINGSLTQTTYNISPRNLSEYNTVKSNLFYLGKDEKHFYKGFVDELVFYNIALVVSEINDHVYLPSITKYPTLYKYGQLYYKMEQSTGSLYLTNDGLLRIPGEIHGNPDFTESLQDYSRFHLQYPSN